MNILKKPLMLLYHVLANKKILVKRSVLMDMERLHPGENQDELCQEYYVGKMVKSMTIFLLGSLLAILLAFRARQEQTMPENMLKRAGVGQGEREVIVETTIEGQREQFQIVMEPTLLTEEAAAALCQEFCENLPEMMCGGNDSLDKVSENLVLAEEYEGYPFWVEWRSDTPDVVSTGGIVCMGEAEKEVKLRAFIHYGEMEWEKVFTVRIMAEELSLSERRHRELEQQLLASQVDTNTSPNWILPDKWEGQDIVWKRVVEDNSILLWIGALGVSVGVYFLGDRDLHREVQKRQEQMRRSYPDIVHKLALYIGAGMTLQGAFCKIASEYGEARARGQPVYPAYEEMVYACRELKSGVAESKVYERFGLRTGLQEYIRLSTLMAQNLKKGSSSLLTRLQEEANRALLDRVQAGRKLGEEASTKLLIPMVMMLAIVMVMVMLPAFSSMGL